MIDSRKKTRKDIDRDALKKKIMEKNKALNLRRKRQDKDKSKETPVKF
jgi:hypothetical protein